MAKEALRAKEQARKKLAEKGIPSSYKKRTNLRSLEESQKCLDTPLLHITWYAETTLRPTDCTRTVKQDH